MKKASRIIISVLLIVAMIVPASVFVKAETNVITTPISQSETNEYYNLKEGLYTKKTVEGPDADGNYDVTIDAYTSDVRYIKREMSSSALDILVLLDNSGSMGTNKSDANSKAYKARKAVSDMLQVLVDAYGAGTKFKANLAVCTFAGKKATMQWTGKNETYKYKSISKSTYADLSKSVYAIDTSDGDTPTDKAFEMAQTVVQDRKAKTGNQQIVLFVTDGHPSLKKNVFVASVAFDKWNHSKQAYESGTDEGVKVANNTLPKAEALKKDAEIYSFGVGDNYKKATYEQNNNTLATIVTDGYATATGTDTRDNIFDDWTAKRDVQVGRSIWVRRGATFMNVVSSGWVATGKVKSYDWGVADNAQVYNKNGTGDYYNLQKGWKDKEIYKNWATKSDSWQNVPSDYIRNTNKSNPGASYYFAGDIDGLAKALSDSVAYTLSTHYVSQGSLLGDFSIKSTMSDYFEIIPNSWNTYKIPYDSKNGAYQADTNKAQYGEGDRAWGTPTSVSMVVETTTGSDGTLNSISLPANEDNASVKDSFIIKDDTALLEATHSGNKLRLTFKVRPKDSFMGGKAVPVDTFEESGIFNAENKAIQNFFTLVSTAGGKETLSSDVSTMPVKLVNGKVSLDNDNVKIGYIYSLDSLGENNLKISYEGRYTDTKYTLLLNSDKECSVYSDGTELIYSKNKVGTETEYHKPSDYVMVAFGNSYADSSSNGIVADSKYIQFNSSGITYSGGSYHQSTPSINKYIYLLWSGMENQETIVNDRFPEYNKTNEDSKAEQEAGIVDDIFYTKGQESARQFDVPVKVNIFVPAIKVNDAVISKASGTKYPVSSDKLSKAFDNLNIQSRKNGTSDNETLNYSMNNGQLSNLALAQMDAAKNNGFVYLVAKNNTVNIDESKNKSVFIEDVYSIAQTDINAYVKRFADKNGVEKSANSVIADKDQIQLTLMYNGFENIFDSLSVNAPFKLTVDEFYATNECNICGNQYMSMFLGYNAQIHQTTNSITVVKTGCDSAHTNSSFVFSVLGFKEKADGSGADINSVKVLNNFTIQGNGQRTVTVDTSAYQYYCVVEDSNALNDVSKGWTWDYSGVSINGIDWKSVENHVFQLQPDEANTVTFENKYNKDNSTLHYASAYAVNTMSNETVESISSDN